MFLCILNPTAGKGRSVHCLEKVKSIFDAHHAEYTVWETTYAGEAVEMARKAVAQGYKHILSVGGDGTVLEVATGLIGADCTLGIIPAGTGNDFIRSLGMDADVEQAAETILRGHTECVDIAETEEKNYFMNVAGCGFDTEVLFNMDRYKKTFKGQIPYILGLLKALVGYRCLHAKIELDDQVLEQDIFLVAIANGKTYGGGMNVAPQADVQDGFFDVTVVDRVSKFTVLSILPNFIKGKHERIKQIRSYKARKVRVTCEKEVPINMDGEIIGKMPMTFEILPRVLRVFKPETVKVI